MEEIREVVLPAFLKMFSMSRTSFERYVYRHDYPLPAYKRGRLWIVDIAEYKKWRDEENGRCRKS